MSKYPVILNGDHAEFEREHANTKPEDRPDWPLPSFDARDWAAAFAKHNPNCGVGEDVMIGWFANALMRGYDERSMTPIPTESERQQAREHAGKYAMHDTYENHVAEMASALAASREAAMPKWRPTHRHYKGGLYRKIGEGIHTETSEPLTFYDNEKGELFARPTAMFNGALDEDGYKLRFTPLPSPPERT